MAESRLTLYYWGGQPGRGEPIRLILEETGTPYDQVLPVPSVGKDGSLDFGAVTSFLEDGTTFAVPILVDKDGPDGHPITLSQLPNIMLYLGKKLGLAGHGAEEYRANQLFLTLCDLQVEAHDTHHPLNVMKYYEEQKEAAYEKAMQFRQTRAPKFLKFFEKVLSTSSGPYFLGEQFTYPDLMLFHVVDGLIFAFPKLMEKQRPSHPEVFMLYDLVRVRSRIVKYMKSDRRAPFGQGLYRHYPELDDE
ncbi:glutathione S-transferase [Fistulina hepatica ATCC 64428]|uniref:Glutathione S-transferase n=1 Tax=Fistulina hepatica ATCC 64428 TaxID=1128425 RepID=A0A0D7AJJ5_9AGAR|nr:glutathione S-transferase [Fistulina hepatica ATCC 64428]